MKILNLLLLLFFSSSQLYCQDYLGYSNENFKIKTDYLKDSVTLNLHLPETYNFSSRSTKYPIIIIFDSQHQQTYPQIVKSIDLLTNESQMPEAIVVGVPFNRKNRYYLTSNQRKGNDSLSGIQKMEKFLFKELIPKLQNENKGNEFIALIGHSRTAFLVNYLLVKESKSIDVAIALSGFYSNKPLSLDIFKSYILNTSNFPKKLHYYYTAGSSLEETTYLQEYKNISLFIAKNELPVNFISRFTENKNVNHMTNYWTSVPAILINFFASYNSILNNWLYHKLKKGNIQNPIKEFKSDLKKSSKDLGFEINPSLTHIFSLASSFLHEKNDVKTAIDFVKLGQKYYPDYSDFYLTLIEYYNILNEKKMVEFYKNVYKTKLMLREDIDEAEKNEFLKNIEN